MKKLFAMILIACLLLTSVSALAAKKPPQKPQKPQEQGQEGQPERLDLQGMVKNGVITQQTMDKIKAFMESNRPEGAAEGEAAQPQEPDDDDDGAEPDEPDEPDDDEPDDEDDDEAEVPGVLGELLKAGVITQEECDAMAAAIAENSK